jgi:hypothetical protein
MYYFYKLSTWSTHVLSIVSPHKVKPVTLSSLMIQYYAGPTKCRYQTARHDRPRSNHRPQRLITYQSLRRRHDDTRQEERRWARPDWASRSRTPQHVSRPHAAPNNGTWGPFIPRRLPPCFNGGDRANPSAPRRPPHMASKKLKKPINNATRFSETGGRAKRKLSRAEHNDSASCPPLLSIQRPSPRHTPLEPLQCRPTCSRPHLPAKPPKAPSWRQ